MSHNISIESGTSVKLKTAGKYCDRDIVVTATGGGSGVTGEFVLCGEATEVGENAFSECTALTSVDLPAAKNIGKNAFYFCDALTSVDLRDGHKNCNCRRRTYWRRLHLRTLCAL